MTTGKSDQGPALQKLRHMPQILRSQRLCSVDMSGCLGCLREREEREGEEGKREGRKKGIDLTRMGVPWKRDLMEKGSGLAA